MHTKKTLLNIVFGFISQIVIIGLGIFIPRLVMLNYGSDTNGFTGTVAQIFTYMALLEAGIGQSTLNSLYGPVANDDRKTISRRMVASRNYYRKITKIYAALVLILSFTLPFFINTQMNPFVAGQVVLFEGLSHVIAFYYLESWKQLLSADGKYYVTQIISMIYSILGYSVKIVLVCLKVNVGVIQFVFFILSLIQMFIYFAYLKRNYSWIDFNEEPDQFALKDRYAFMLNQIAVTIFTSTDMIVLAVIGSASLASVYSVYGLIYNNITRILNAIYFGTVFILGQVWQKDKKEYCYLHDAFDIFSHWLITSTITVAYIMSFPFISLYTKGVHDINYILPKLPLLFSLIQMLSWNRYVNGNLTAIAGYAKKVSKISCIEAFINLTASIVFGLYWNIYGVLFATVIALPVKVIFCLIFSNHTILKRSIWNSLKIIVINYILFFTTIIINKQHTIMITSFTEFFLSAFIVAIIIYPVFLIFNILCNMNIFLHYLKKGALLNVKLFNKKQRRK